jgi:hypothetical protein
MPLDDLFADGQPDTGSLILVAMEPLEDPEDLFEVLRIDTYAVIRNAEDPFLLATGSPTDTELTVLVACGRR